MGRVGGEVGCFVFFRVARVVFCGSSCCFEFFRVACVVFCGCSCSADKVVAEPFEGSALITIVFIVGVVVAAKGCVGGQSGGGRRRAWG